MNLTISHYRGNLLINEFVVDSEKAQYMVTESCGHDDNFVAVDEYNNMVIWALKHLGDRVHIIGEAHGFGQETKYIDIYAALEDGEVCCLYDPRHLLADHRLIFRLATDLGITTHIGKVEGKIVGTDEMAIRCKDSSPCTWLFVPERMIPK